MVNFREVLSFVDIRAALAEVSARPELWSQITVRQDYAGSAHHDTESIFIRGPVPTLNVFDEVEACEYLAAALLPACVALVRELAERVIATKIGRVMVVKLKAGGVIDEHLDEGAYAEHYQRFHIVLSSLAGNRFVCGGETAFMHPGTAWWFDHQQLHSVRNDSEADRLHLIVDMVTAGPWRLL